MSFDSHLKDSIFRNIMWQTFTLWQTSYHRHLFLKGNLHKQYFNLNVKLSWWRLRHNMEGELWGYGRGPIGSKHDWGAGKAMPQWALERQSLKDCVSGGPQAVTGHSSEWCLRDQYIPHYRLHAFGWRFATWGQFQKSMIGPVLLSLCPISELPCLCLLPWSHHNDQGLTLWNCEQASVKCFMSCLGHVASSQP